MVSTRFVIPMVVAALLGACGKSAEPVEGTPVKGEAPKVDAGWDGKNEPDNLTALLRAIRASADTDPARAAALTRGLLVDAESVKVAVANEELAKNIVGQVAQVPRDDAQVAHLLDPKKAEYTETRAHAATTEEIVANDPTTVAYKEFPGGVRKLAEKGYLQKGVTFYEVEWTAPGEDAGMKYHLFFWDGARWRMLGPAWRGVE